MVVDRIQDSQTGLDHPLDGVYVQLARNVSTVDGIESTQSFSYDPASGQLIATATTVWNVLGRQEARTKSVVLGYLNMLGQQVGSRHSVAVGDDPAVVTAEQSLLMKLFPGIPLGEAGALQLLCPWQSYARMEPGSGTVGDAPQEWLLQSRVNACNPYGYPAETANTDGLITSTLYAADNSPAVATFSGASVIGQEAYYFGFEPYEASGSWALDYEVTPRVTTICCTGTQCLSLPPGVTGAPLELTPQDRSRQVRQGASWCKDFRRPRERGLIVRGHGPSGCGSRDSPGFLPQPCRLAHESYDLESCDKGGDLVFDVTDAGCTRR